MQIELVAYLQQRLRITRTNFATTLVATVGCSDNIVGSVDVFAARRPDSMRCICAHHYGSPHRVYGHGHCESLAVAHEHRRRGCARQLLKHSEDTVAAWGYPWMTLQVETGNEAAKALYSQAGYHLLDSRRRPLRPWKAPVELLGKQLK